MLLKWPESGSTDEAAARRDGDSRGGARAAVAVRRSVAVLLSIVSVGWIFLGLLYVGASSGFGALALMLPHELAFVVLALAVPPAFAWLAGFWYWRSVDARESRAALARVLRDMSFPNAEAEARLNAMTLSLRRLSQTLESETANALERVAGLDERIGRGARALGDAAQKSGEQADELSRLLDQRASSQQALLERIGELDSRIRTLGEVQAGRLGAAVSEAGRQTAVIEQSLRAQVASADAAVEDVGKRARQIAETIGQPLGRLREESESVTRQVAGAVQDIRNRVEALAQTVARTMDQAGSVREGIEDQVGRLRNVLGDAQTAVIRLGEQGAQRLTELSDTADRAAAVADAAAQKVGQRTAGLAKSLDDINVGTAEAEEALVAAGENARAAAERLADQMRQLADQSTDSLSRSDEAADRIALTVTALADADGRLAGTVSGLQSGQASVDATVEHVTGTVSELVDRLEERLRGAASLAESSAERSEVRLSRFVSALRDSMTELGVRLQAVEQQAAQAAARGDASVEHLSGRSHDLLGVLDDIRAMLESGVASIEQVTQRSLAAAERLGGSVNEVDAATGRLETRAAEAASSLLDAAGGVEERGLRTLNTLKGTEQAFDHRARVLETLGDRMEAATARAETELAARMDLVADRVEAAGAGARAQLVEVSGAVSGLVADLEARLAAVQRAGAQADADSAAAGSRLAERTAELALLFRDIENAVGSAAGMIDGLDNRARQSMDLLRESVGTVDAAAGGLTDRSEAAAGRLRDLTTILEARAAVFANLSRSLAETASSIGGDTAGMVDDMVRRFGLAGDSAREALALVQGEGQRLEQRAMLLRETVESTAAGLDGRLAAAAQAATTAAATLAERTAEIDLMIGDLVAATGKGGAEATALHARLSHTVSSLNSATTGLAATIVELGDAATRQSGRIDLAANAVKGQAADLQARLEATGAALAGEGERMAELVARLQGSADERALVLSTRLQDMARRVDEAGDLARVMVEALEAGTGGLTAEAEQVREKVMALAAELGQRVDAIDEAADRAATRVGGAAGELELKADAISATAARLAHEARARAEGLTGQIETVAARAGDAEARLVRASQAIEQASASGAEAARTATAAMGETVTAIEAGMQRAGDIEIAVDRLASAAETAQARMAAISVEGQDLAARLSERAADLAGEAASLVDRASGGTDRLVEMLARMQAEGLQLAESERLAAERAGHVARLLETIAARADASGNLMENAAAGIDAASLRSSEAAQRAATILAETMASIDGGLDRAATVESAIGRLSEAATAARDGMAAIAEQGEALSDGLAARGAALAGQARTLAEAAAGGTSTLLQALDSLREASDRTAASEADAARQAAELVAGLEQRATRFGELAGVLEQTGSRVSQELNDRLAALDTAGTAANEAATRLADTFQTVRQRLDQAASGATTDAESLKFAVEDAMREVETVSATFAARLDKTRDAASALGEDGLATVERLDTALRNLTEAGEALRATSEHGAGLMEQRQASFIETLAQSERAAREAEEVLSKQATTIATAGQAATLQANLAARAFEAQSSRLEKAAGAAARAAVEMRNRSSEFRDRRFLKSAAFVAEGLNSLALDLHRVLDPAATEREWKRHYRGDKGLFTRRLVGTQDRARIAALYESDGDFRRFVDLYVNEFESLMQTAGQADQEKMLMGVFLSADVGKLYLMLCDALDHKPAGARPFALGA